MELGWWWTAARDGWRELSILLGREADGAAHSTTHDEPCRGWKWDGLGARDCGRASPGWGNEWGGCDYRSPASRAGRTDGLDDSGVRAEWDDGGSWVE